LRVEGHASSEWSEMSSAEIAFIRNMSLSQARAHAILEKCLVLSESLPIAEWARTHLVATGYSSARVLRDSQGLEETAASRRVVFRAQAGDRLIDEIEAELNTSE